jgi:dipeptidyl aminopeptidase/acylaminoacyl peptidase
MKRHLLIAALFACGTRPTPTPIAPPPVDPPSGDATAAAPVPPPAATGTPRTDLIPRKVLFGNPERAAVRISPDGTQLSWLAPKDGVMNVWVAPIDKLDAARPVTSETKRPIHDYQWAHTSKHLLFGQDTGGDENFHIFRVDVATATTTDLTPATKARAGIEWSSPRMPTKVIIAINDRDPQLMDLHELDIVTGKRTLLLQNEHGIVGFSIDHAGKVRFAQKRAADGSTEILERVGAAWKPFDQVPFADAESTGIVGFTPDNRSLYYLESRDRDTSAFVQVDPRTRKKTVLAEDPKADAGDTLAHPTTRAVQAVKFEYDRARWQILDKSIEPDLAALAKLDAGSDVHIAGRTTDDRRWIVATSSEQKPGRYYVWDRGKRAARFLFSVQPELEKQPLVKMHPVVIESRDRLAMVSYLSLPAAADPDGDGKPTAPVPMVLYVHGGPWARDNWGFEPIHQLLANRGYAVLSVNYRGSTGFGKTYINAANREWGRKMHDDLLDAVEWAVKAGIAPRDKVGILGGSYGGYATLVGLAMTPDVFACGVDLVGVSSLPTFIASIPPYWAPYLSVLRARVGDPDTADGKALLIARSPLTHATNIKRPLLIGQGANDPRVKQAESEQIVAAMQQHRLPVTYALFPDEGHGFARPENNIAFFAITEAFLSAHLGGVYQPITKNELEASSMRIPVGDTGVPGLPR